MRPEEVGGLMWKDIEYEHDYFWAGRHTVVKNGIYENGKRIRTKLGISEIGCYSLRHEFFTYLAQETNTDRATIKQLAGWSEIIESYFHTDDEHKHKAVISIDNQYVNEQQLKNKEKLYDDNNIIIFPLQEVVNK